MRNYLSEWGGNEWGAIAKDPDECSSQLHLLLLVLTLTQMGEMNAFIGWVGESIRSIRDN
jgi:hypothetical protein